MMPRILWYVLKVLTRFHQCKPTTECLSFPELVSIEEVNHAVHLVPWSLRLYGVRLRECSWILYPGKSLPQARSNHALVLC